MKIYYHKLDTIIGNLWVSFSNKGLVRIDLPGISKEDYLGFLSAQFDNIAEYEYETSEYGKQLELYFKGKIKVFDLPLEIEGTDFQRKVWSELLKVPYGKTKTYQQIAEAIGNSKACRAVGGANNKNRIPIIIPCHRIVGKDGDLVGFAGDINNKVKLLQLEGINVNRRIRNNITKYYIEKQAIS